MKNKVVIPLNVNGNHWANIAVSKDGLARTRRFTPWFLDSYWQPPERYYEVFERVWKKLFVDAPKVYAKHGLTLKMNSKPMVTPSSSKELPPLQTNAKDCGVFMCVNAFCFVHDLPLNTFKSKDMKVFFRQHMFMSVMQGHLHELITYPKIE